MASKSNERSSYVRLAVWLLVGLGFPSVVQADPPVRFSRDIQPILADKCFQCHGPDQSSRKAKLRLDRKEDALADRGGSPTITPRNLEKSELYRRIVATDAEHRMPPAKFGKKLTPREIDLIRRWIEEGATWEAHWAFTPPKRPPLPILTRKEEATWPRNAIDHFVLARLQQEGMKPSAEAPRHVLIRRLTFDLLGLPPTPAEVDAFVSDKNPDAYEKLVDRLLQSEHFGERMAMDWLDAARYSDTDGFQNDDTRTNWPWRDWVVSAFNRNLPYNQFTIEQFAGDLLPNATADQKLATCFHRNHMTNGEGGRDPEESRIDYVIDRVNTMGTVWLGLTLGCCQCHGHRYDPISQPDYYRLFAFFNSIDEDGKAGRGAKPFLAYPTPYASRAIAEAQRMLDDRKAQETRIRKEAQPAFERWLQQKTQEVKSGYRAWRPFLATSFETLEGTRLTQTPDGIIQTSGPNPRHEDYRVIGPIKLPRVTGFRLEVLPHASNTDGGLSRSRTGHFILTDVKVHVRRRDDNQIREIAIANALADYSADPKKHGGYGDIKHTLDDDPRNGWATFDRDPHEPRVAQFAFAEPLVLDAEEELIIELRQRSTQGQHNLGRFRVSLTDQAGPTVRDLAPSPLESLANARDIDPKLRARLLDTFLEDHPPHREAQARLERATRHASEMKKLADKVEVMVLAERKQPRDTHVLIRGVWDKRGEKVERDALTQLAPWPAGEAKSRLGLARWLVARDNPLTARVAVNRYWQMLFGTGLVRTPEDFGLQGEPPTHPELLDWLAVEFMNQDWNVKHLLRTIVTSATYRQRSEVSEALRARDPENRLLGRAGRFRLPSWMIRDAALRSSGLLHPVLGGPPVRPYQPKGVWEEIFMGRFKYEPSEDGDQYRRTIYAFWRRSVAPTFLFDSAQRRVCEVRTPRTNTPLQALTLLNDLTYVEASRVLAEGAMRSTPNEKERLRHVTRSVLARMPTDRELAVLERELTRARAYYRIHRAEANRWLSHGQTRPRGDVDSVELAAVAVVANLVLNLDEAITRE